MTYNLSSKNNIRVPLNRKNLLEWFNKDIEDLEPSLQEIYLKIFSDIDSLCSFSEKALLLWTTCDRKPPSKGKQKYHAFTETIKQQAKKRGVVLDSRPNGPAIAAFEFAEGKRPQRHGSNNKWHIHHLYSGKFPYIGKKSTLHATKECLHFTQAAGLVALHPLADALADESPAFTWVLRYKAYEKFGYDPDQVFSEKINEWGFDINRTFNLEIISN